MKKHIVLLVMCIGLFNSVRAWASYGPTAFEYAQEDYIVVGGVATDQGGRGQQEDRYCLLHQDKSTLLGVFDGHGGCNAAEYSSQTLLPLIANQKPLYEDYKQLFNDCFFAINEGFREQSSGTTATIAALFGQKLYLAHVGDSRGLCALQNGEILVTRDHKPGVPVEKERIIAAGGDVTITQRKLDWYDGYQQRLALGPLELRHVGISTLEEYRHVESAMSVPGYSRYLAVSRSIGDFKFKQGGSSAEPESREFDVDDIAFVVLASDGLWDVISNEDVVRFVYRWMDVREVTLETLTSKDAQELTQALVHDGIQRSYRLFPGSPADNITVMFFVIHNRRVSSFRGDIEGGFASSSVSEVRSRHRLMEVSRLGSDTDESSSEKERSSRCHCLRRCMRWFLG